MSNEPERERSLRNISKEYREFFTQIMETDDKERIRFMLFFYDWVNNFAGETLDANEKAFIFRTIFAIAKRLLDSKLDGGRLIKIEEIVSSLRSLNGDKDALFIAEYLKLQLFEDCELDSENPDWVLVDKYLNHWAEASKGKVVTITYYRRDDKGEIIVDKERITEAGPPFFRHCSAECVEWFYSMELKPIDYDPNSLMELDRVIDNYWPKERFRDVDIEGEENPYSRILLRLMLMTGSYLGEVLVRSLGGIWDRAEDLGWHIRLKEERINVFNIAKESFQGSPKFYETFRLAQEIKK
ncbi:MAG: hypothetical protein QXF52_05980 [Thermoproteota archaeon]